VQERVRESESFEESSRAKVTGVGTSKLTEKVWVDRIGKRDEHWERARANQNKNESKNEKVEFSGSWAET
jgi:hypothetical protein